MDAQNGSDPRDTAGHWPGCTSLDHPSLFINRELSWIAFNSRVLEEAMDVSHPLLERVKFLSIFSNNLDEFFMIRVSGLQRQAARGVREAPPDGMGPARQLAEIHRALGPLLHRQTGVWHQDIMPALAARGIRVLSCNSLDPGQRAALGDMFMAGIYPVLTPLAFDTSHPFPFISNLSLNLAVTVKDPGSGEEHFARLKVPTSLFPRLIVVPSGEPGTTRGTGETCLVFLEDLIASHLDTLFPGFEVAEAYPFRVTRDADFEIEEDEAGDLLTAVEESVEQRRTGSPVRVEVADGMPGPVCDLIGKKLGLPSSTFYRLKPPLGLADLSFFSSLDRPDLKDTPFIPSVPAVVEEHNGLYPAIRERDLLLFHPYESFMPVIDFLRQAARDPEVLAIKITLYRVGKDSPVIDALLEARENRKAVAAVIELKARFDEENNITWARALERAGVHVVYGLPGLKVHAKICMVVRREKDGIRTYVHMSTGNYNVQTSRVYTDLGYFTADPQTGADAADLFNSLTGCARISSFRKLLAAPAGIRSGILSRIDREIVRHSESGDGRIIFKLNALVDRECITALYRASRAGVKVDLQVRGICCLRPGVAGISENITVTSIVGRFLEHSRVYYFRNGGNEEFLIGSADLMPRNLDRRVEILFPVSDPGICSGLRDLVIPIHLSDNVKLRVMLPDGTYRRAIREEGVPVVNAQEWCVRHRGAWQHGQAAR
ncbi:MAG TPA: polyphosphate kinase 1 [Methanoregulaceae archaeon]|nr:MAG: polyphosphate kinase 1 [Methanolinea sp.]HON81339.1 polyphosphate kinase 1 [Methanoregulaceae archaeon]HPD09797.1 polyphosphate kinase 1 [Methanoregulaceae archaeon]HRT14482.1 polyphosphate kinase 1 [Methanoregulaceae archaeon]HRU30053.1 polyphosphate kinase 1 [Methanoregulaceae archaeon]